MHISSSLAIKCLIHCNTEVLCHIKIIDDACVSICFLDVRRTHIVHSNDTSPASDGMSGLESNVNENLCVAEPLVIITLK